jgi:hypothetical protein
MGKGNKPDKAPDKTLKASRGKAVDAGKSNTKPTGTLEDPEQSAAVAASAVTAAATASAIAAAAADENVNDAPPAAAGDEQSSPAVSQRASVARSATSASDQRRRTPAPKVVVEGKSPNKRESQPLPVTTSLAAAIPELVKGTNITFCTNMKVTESGLKVCAIRCRTSFRHKRSMYNHERGWVRVVLQAAIRIYFVECAGSFPLLICFFGDAPIVGGVGIGADNVPSNRSAKSREAVLERILTVTRPVRNTLNLDITIPTEAKSNRTVCELYGTAPAMADVQKYLDNLGEEHAIRRHRQEVQGFVGALASRLTGSNKDQLLPFHPNWYQSKRCIINGLVRATVHLTDTEIENIRKTSGLVVMPLTHVINFDEKLEERQLAVRFAGNIDVNAFHSIIVEKLCRNPDYQALASYVTYNTLCVTVNKPVSRATLHKMHQMLSKETTDVRGSWHIIPDTDKLPSAWEQKVAALPRMSFIPNERVVQQEVVVRRTVAVSAPVDPVVMALVAKQLGFALVTARDCDFSVAPLRFVGEWPTVEKAKEVEGEENAVQIQIGDYSFVLEVLSPLDEQRV